MDGCMIVPQIGTAVMPHDIGARRQPMIDEHHEGAAICHKIIILRMGRQVAVHRVPHIVYVPLFLAHSWQTDSLTV